MEAHGSLRFPFASRCSLPRGSRLFTARLYRGLPPAGLAGRGSLLLAVLPCRRSVRRSSRSLRFEASLAVLGRPRCLRKPTISGSERIGDPRSTEELRSSGMTKDGSRSRLSNHARVSSLHASLLPLASFRGLSHCARSASLRSSLRCGVLARHRRAGCQRCRNPIPWSFERRFVPSAICARLIESRGPCERAAPPLVSR